MTIPKDNIKIYSRSGFDGSAESGAKPLINAVAYARFSSDNQREESIEAQVRAIKYYAQNFGYNIVKVYADRAKTGKTDDRPNFIRMINDSRSGMFDVVLVHKLDRFSRNPADTNYYEKVLNQNGVKLISVLEKLDDTPEGQLMKQIIIGMNSFYSANLAREVKKGLKENALQAKFTGGVVNFGYKLDADGHFIIHEKNAEAVRLIFEWYALGVSKMVIVKRLNEMGYRSARGNYFTPRTIFDILRNPKYIGTYVYESDGETIVIEDALPALISEELWLKVQEETKRTDKRKYGEQKRTYYLTGKMKCGICGGKYSGGSSKKNKYGAEYYYYICGGTKTKMCNARGVNKEEIENLVIDEIAKNILSDEMIDKIASEAVEYANREIQNPTVSSAELTKQAKEVSNKIDKVMDLYLEGMIDKETVTKKAEQLKEQLKNIEMEKRKAIQLESSPALKKNDFIDFIKAYRIDASDAEMAMLLIDTFIDEVIVFPDRFDITFKIDFDLIGGSSLPGKQSSTSFSGSDDGTGGALRKFVPTFNAIPPMIFCRTYSRKKKFFPNSAFTRNRSAGN